MKNKKLFSFLLTSIMGMNCIGGSQIYAMDLVNNNEVCIVKQSIDGTWNNEFISNINITNNTDEAIDKWVLQFKFAGEIKQIWNGRVVSCVNDIYTIEAHDWNKRIAGGANVQIGFIGSRQETTIEPVDFKVLIETDDQVSRVEQWCSFMPKESGSYELTMVGNGTIKNKIYEAPKEESDVQIGQSNKVAGTLLKDKKYYFKVVTDNKEQSTYLIDIKKVKEPTNELFEKQWGLLNKENGIDINILPVWQYVKGNGAVVGVADTGIDYTHHNLINNVDLDLSYNFVHDIKDTFPVDELYNSMSAAGGHGTLVGGIIGAGVDDKNKGTIGVAPECKISSLKIIGNEIEGHPVYENSIEAFAKAVEYAEANDIKIINCSFGGSFPSVVEKEVMLAAKDILFVISAGNLGEDLGEIPSYPACYYHDNSLVVAAVDSKGELVSFSNYGGPTEIVAPGEDVIGTFPYNDYGEGTGTSMAAPFVSGVGALILSLNKDLTPVALKKQIIDNATVLENIQDKVVGGKLLNAYNAVIIPKQEESIPNYANRQVLGFSNKKLIDYYKNQVGIDEKTNKVIVKFKDDKNVESVIERVIKETGIQDIEVEDYIDLIGSYVIKCADIESADEIAKVLNTYDVISYAEMNYLRKM